MARVAFNKHKTLHKQTGLEFKEELNEMLKLERSSQVAKILALRKIDHTGYVGFEK
jgi:hypothetical protein